jgi:hypothetical protein
MILSGLLQAAEDYEKNKALAKLAELTPKISRLRHSGYTVTVTLEVEQPDAPDFLAKPTGTGNQGQIVYYHDLYISSSLRKSLASSQPASNVSSMRASGEADYSRPAWYVEQPVHPYHHVVRGDEVLPVLSTLGGTYRPVSVTSAYATGRPEETALNTFGMRRTLVIHGEDDSFTLYDDDAPRAPWTLEMPKLREPISIAPTPGLTETRFVRPTRPLYSLESLWSPRTIDANGAKVQGFYEAVLGQSEEPGTSRHTAGALFVWVKVSD